MKLLTITTIVSIALSLPFLQQIDDVTVVEMNLKDTISCIKTNCPTQYATCQKDEKCVAALNACQTKCGSSQSCWSFCLPGKGSESAIDAFKCGSDAKCVNINS